MLGLEPQSNWSDSSFLHQYPYTTIFLLLCYVSCVYSSQYPQVPSVHPLLTTHMNCTMYHISQLRTREPDQFEVNKWVHAKGTTIYLTMYVSYCLSFYKYMYMAMVQCRYPSGAHTPWLRYSVDTHLVHTQGCKLTLRKKPEKVHESGLKTSKTGWKYVKVWEFGLHNRKNSCKSRKTYIPDTQ